MLPASTFSDPIDRSISESETFPSVASELPGDNWPGMAHLAHETDFMQHFSVVLNPIKRRSGFGTQSSQLSPRFEIANMPPEKATLNFWFSLNRSTLFMWPYTEHINYEVNT
jgi:hypothetical protein